MRFDRIRLTNFKPYEDADLSLTDGVTVIHGVNGSGKSSLLDACFFALYGARALDETLDDVVTTGADEAEVDLWFTHDGGEYHVHRRLRRSGDRIGTAACTLEGPDATYDGARDVRSRVSSMLRMDADAFVNCAYVRQGEVNKLINATPQQRQAMLDDLLQLGKLEEYRERAGKARLGIEDVLTAKRELLADKVRQIERKEEADPHARLNALQSDLAAVEEKLDNFETQREKARAQYDEATATLESHAETRDELASLESEIDDIEEAVRETERDRDDLQERIRETLDRRETLETRLTETLDDCTVDDADPETLAGRREALDDREAEIRDELTDRRDAATAFENQATNLRQRAAEHEEEATERRRRVEELQSTLSEASAELETRLASLDEVDAERERLLTRFEDAGLEPGEATDHRDTLRERLEAHRDEITDVTGSLRTARNQVEEAERLQEAGKCPECGQSVEGSPHVESLATYRERVEELEAQRERSLERKRELEDELERAEDLVEAAKRLEELETTREMVEARIEDQRERIDDAESRIETLREEAEEAATAAEDLREVAAEKADQSADASAEVDSLEATLETLETARERLDRVERLHREVADTDERLERFRERRDSLAELNDERRERLREKRDRRKELGEAIDDVDIGAVENRKEQAETYLEKVAEKLSTLADRRDELQGKIGGVKQDIEQLESLREQRRRHADRVEALESLHEEAEELEAMYGDLRSELRRRNVETLERMLNETFDLVYGNDAYSHIRLDGEYELTVFQKDGTALTPDQLSGGERALFNLSLRCAIYRLLAEGIDGAAPMPPLILDEPTVFLDSGHVSRLVDLVEEMRSLGVRQILIVSHDDELVGAAEDLVEVEKNPTTNRSSVRRVDDPTLDAVASAGLDD